MRSRKKSTSPPKRAKDVLHRKPLDVIKAYENHLVLAAEGAESLNVSVATFRRWVKAWRESGKLPAHGNARRVPHNKVPAELRERIIHLIDTKYFDFQATLLHKYLAEHEGITVSVEWLRRLLVELRPEENSTERRRAAHRLRRRRSSRGQLVQIDGSHHPWFPGDEASYCLIAFIDDATGEILNAGFSSTETTEAYLDVLRGELFKNGLPAALYSDRHSVFTATAGDIRSTESAETQFQRACRHLGIELILAHSPEAKGRVERAFKTLQGRWPKEFRVLGIRDMAEANARMPELLERFNEEFAIAPANSEDSHVPLEPEDREELELIFAKWHARSISRNLTVSHGKQILQIIGVSRAMRMAMAKTNVEVVTHRDGRVELYWHDERQWKADCLRQGKEVRKHYVRIDYKAHDRKSSQPVFEEPPTETAKTIDKRVDAVMEARGSPWRASMRQWAQKAEAKREKRIKAKEEAQEIEARIAAAKAALQAPH